MSSYFPAHRVLCCCATTGPHAPLVQRVQRLPKLENGARSVRGLGLALRFAKEVHRRTGSKTRQRRETNETSLFLVPSTRPAKVLIDAGDRPRPTTENSGMR